MDVSVAHIIAADADAPRLDLLEALLSQGAAGLRQTVMRVGAGSGSLLSDQTDALGRRAPGTEPGARPGPLHAPFDVPWLGGSKLERELADVRPDVVHVWSPLAARWCAPLLAHRTRVLVQADLADRVDRHARWFRSRGGTATVAFICPAELCRRRLVERGVAAEACVVLRPYVDFGRINRGRSVEVRGPLGLSEEERLLLLLPPIRRDAGQFTAVWAALLVHVIRADLRIVVPTTTREARRLQRLAKSVRREGAMRFPGDRFTLSELLGAADLAMYLPPGDASVAALPWAMAAGRPILASATYAVTELLADRHNAWLVKPDDPKAAAQKLLRLIESPLNETRGPVELARAQAFEVFSRQRMVQQFRQVYDNLRQDRPAGEGVSDSAVRT